MDGNAACEKLHAILIERRKLLRELESLSGRSRERIVESRKSIARAERICAEPRMRPADDRRS